MSSPQAIGVLQRLGGVRLRERLPEEELDEAAEVPIPVVPVVLRPALAGVEHRVEVGPLAPPGLLGEVGHRRGDRDDGADARGVRRRELQGVAAAARETGGDHRRDAQVVEDRDGVGDRLGVRVGGLVGRRVGQAAAPGVERHDPRVAREVGHLRLPHARVHDGPARQEQDRRAARAVGPPTGRARRRGAGAPRRPACAPGCRCRCASPRETMGPVDGAETDVVMSLRRRAPGAISYGRTS